MAKDLRVHEPRLDALVFLLFLGGLVKKPCTARNVSIVASADDTPMASVILKATGCTEVMALLTVLTLKVTDVVE